MASRQEGRTEPEAPLWAQAQQESGQDLASFIARGLQSGQRAEPVSRPQEAQGAPTLGVLEPHAFQQPPAGQEAPTLGPLDPYTFQPSQGSGNRAQEMPSRMPWFLGGTSSGVLARVPSTPDASQLGQGGQGAQFGAFARVAVVPTSHEASQASQGGQGAPSGPMSRVESLLRASLGCIRGLENVGMATRTHGPSSSQQDASVTAPNLPQPHAATPPNARGWAPAAAQNVQGSPSARAALDRAARVASSGPHDVGPARRRASLSTNLNDQAQAQAQGGLGLGQSASLSWLSGNEMAEGGPGPAPESTSISLSSGPEARGALQTTLPEHEGTAAPRVTLDMLLGRHGQDSQKEDPTEREAAERGAHGRPSPMRPAPAVAQAQETGRRGGKGGGGEEKEVQLEQPRSPLASVIPRSAWAKALVRDRSEGGSPRARGDGPKGASRPSLMKISTSHGKELESLLNRDETSGKRSREEISGKLSHDEASGKLPRVEISGKLSRDEALENLSRRKESRTVQAEHTIDKSLPPAHAANPQTKGDEIPRKRTGSHPEHLALGQDPMGTWARTPAPGQEEGQAGSSQPAQGSLEPPSQHKGRSSKREDRVTLRLTGTPDMDLGQGQGPDAPVSRDPFVGRLLQNPPSADTFLARPLQVPGPRQQGANEGSASSQQRELRRRRELLGEERDSMAAMPLESPMETAGPSSRASVRGVEIAASTEERCGVQGEQDALMSARDGDRDAGSSVAARPPMPHEGELPTAAERAGNPNLEKWT